MIAVATVIPACLLILVVMAPGVWSRKPERRKAVLDLIKILFRRK